MTAVAFLTTRTRAPTSDDLGKLGRVLRYLNATKELGMILESDKDVHLLVYVDASFGVHIDGKSYTGVTISLGRGTVHVRSSTIPDFYLISDRFVLATSHHIQTLQQYLNPQNFFEIVTVVRLFM